MSRRALHNAVRDILRAAEPDGLGYDPKICDVTFDGRPPPRCGELFVAVHQGARRRGLYPSGFLDEYYVFYVTVTLRINQPWDRLGTDLIDRVTDGLDDTVDAIRAIIQRQQWVIANAANAAIGASLEDGEPRGFVEAPYYEDDGPARIEGSSWFFAQNQPLSAAVTTIRFGGARRIQYLTEPYAS